MPIFITEKWFYDQSGGSYNINKQMRFKTPMSQSDLCDYSDKYIVVKEIIIVADPNDDAYDKKLAFKHNTPFISCILKIHNTLSNNAEDSNIVIPMYNLIEYSEKLVELLQR